MSAMSDAKFDEVKARLNDAIHEIVFACQHIGDDNFDDAATCLVTAQGTIEQIAEEVVGFEKAAK